MRELSDSPGPIALFLGAGSSAPFGYPVTRELTDKILRTCIRAEKARKRRALGRRRSSGKDTLLRYLRRLLPGYRGLPKQVPLVTSVLSLLDYSIGTGHSLLPDEDLDLARLARRQLQQALIDAIPDWEWFESSEKEKFDSFVGWLRSLREWSAPGELSIITTNYDMVSDTALYKALNLNGDFGDWSFASVAQKVDYGFAWRDPYRDVVYRRPVAPDVALLKLHGSTNWLRCPLCEAIYINPDGPVATMLAAKSLPETITCDCRRTRLESLLVSMSFVRELRNPNLEAVWQTALAALRRARHWIIIGYGFPDEDVAIRALFVRALNSSDESPRVTVVQRSRDALPNYLSYFPPRNFEYLSGGFESLLQAHVSLDKTKPKKKVSK